MAFTPTTWVDGTTAITATELNRIEQGIDDAHAGDIDNNAITTNKIASGAVTQLKTNFWLFGSTMAGIAFGMATDGTLNGPPTGWSVTNNSTGDYTLTYTGSIAPFLFLQPRLNAGERVASITAINTVAKTIAFNTYQAGSLADTELHILAIYALS